MPTVKDKTSGDVVSRQPYTAEGTQRAEQIAESDPTWEIDYAPGGQQDASARNESYQLGGLIPGQQGFGKRPIVSPPVMPVRPISPTLPLMEKGGKVERKARRKARREARQEKRNLRKISKRAVKLEKKTPGEGLSYVDKPKNVDSSKLSPTGRIRAGSKKVTITEGGAYATYKKKSAPAKSFRKAFAAAKGKDFTWDGRKYSGKTKEQAAKAKASKAKSKGKPDKRLKVKTKAPAISTPKPKKFTKAKPNPKILGIAKKDDKIEPLF